jgi:raffinose/stachyose/melibiose transport system permease protein
MTARRGSSLLFKALSFGVVLLFTFFVLYPLCSLVLKFVKSGSSLPEVWRLGNFGGLLLNGFLYSALSAVVSVFLGLMAGFALSKLRVRSAGFFRVFFCAGIFFAIQPMLAPLVLGAKAAGLFNSRLGVLIPCLGLGIPLGVFFGAEFIKSIPDAVLESARLDGAGYFRIFRSIIFPMAAPAAGLIGALTFLAVWNEFLLVAALTGDPSPALSLSAGLMRFISGAGEGDAAAALVLGLAPSLVIFLFLRKQFIRAAGMIRG